MRMAMALAVLAAAVPVGLLLATRAQALDNGLGRTPPLGWNDWNTFGCATSDSLIRGVADAMVSSGMAAAGYQYVNIDDCWEASTRDGSGNLRADPTKFPNGIKAVADYVHSKGLKLGIYSEAGTTTCAGYPGSIGHETQDAQTFASWGVDYLKYDNCGDHQGLTTQQRYTAMRDALLATGRPILYNLCEWGQDAVWTWGAGVGNSWRDTGDISANWGSVMSILDSQVGLAAYSGPGGWNDPDMLEVGNSGLSDTESQAHFSLWSLLNAPLIAGNDIRSMSAATRAILTNTDVLAVDQDWGGKQGYKVRDDGDQEVWAKPMSNGSVAVILLNRGSATSTISTTASQVGLATTANYTLKDLWSKATSQSGGVISAPVPSHGVAMYLVSGAGLSSPSAAPSRSTGPSPTTSAPPTAPASAPPTTTGGAACTGTYQVVSSWGGGFQGAVTVTDTGGRAITGWTVTWTFRDGQAVTQTWNGTATQSGAAVSVANASYNASLGTGAATSFGFLANWNTANTAPTDLACHPT
ncbi:MAG TPA: cellulose binding domain-containing protein [Rugosimonospora sp.]|nr:cellulose binding domain-containing protein [Rugosimonospora sp.]